MGMTEREDTIERIERVLKLTHKKSITVTIPRLTAELAVSMLKAQEPRVMKFDELEDTIADRAVWYEAFLTEVPTIAIVCEKSIADDAYTIFDFISGRHRVTRKTYGACWRCWTSRPTDEQRKETQWSEPPKEET